MSTPGADRYAAAWGDPPIVLRCGVNKPRALHLTSPCFVTNGVGWLATQGGRDVGASRVVKGTIEFFTIGRNVYVEVTVPGADAPQANALVDLARPIRAATRVVRPCV